MSEEPAQYLSLGASCFPATFLRRRGLRKYAGPFDWVFSSPDMIIDCLRDDFKDFLDADQATDAGQPNRANHKKYSEMLERATVFNHHDPRIEEHHAYLERSVERFRLLLRSSHRKVLLLCSLDCRFPLELQGVRLLFQELAAQTSGMLLLVVRFSKPSCAQAEPAGVTEALRESIGSNDLLVHDMLLQGGHTGLFFENPSDEAAFDSLMPHPGSGLADPLQECSRAPLIPVLCLETLQLPPSSLSPRLETQRVEGLKVVLKEATALRILKAVGGERRETSEKCQRGILSTRDFGSEATLLVVPELPESEREEVQRRITSFLLGGPGVRAVLLPDALSSCVQATDSHLAAQVYGLRFSAGFDLFRIPDLSRPVAGGLRVEKAPATKQAFQVLASPASKFQPPSSKAKHQGANREVDAKDL